LVKKVAIFTGVFLLFIGCVPPRRLPVGTYADQMPPFSQIKALMNTHPVKKGYGSVEIVHQKEKMRCDFDFYSQGSNGARLVYYSFFGNEIASILFREDSSTIDFQNRVIRLPSREVLDSVAFFSTGPLTSHDLLQVQSGIIPEVFLSVPFLPNGLSKKGSETTLEYVDSTKMIKVLLLLRFETLKRIIFIYSEHGNSFSIEQSSFVDGIPRTTTLKVDDKNYYRITYKKIRNP